MIEVGQVRYWRHLRKDNVAKYFVIVASAEPPLESYWIQYLDTKGRSIYLSRDLLAFTALL
jgi:hypothetical protein